jgi:hypothetical protein
LRSCLGSGRTSLGGARHRANRSSDGRIVRIKWMYFHNVLLATSATATRQRRQLSSPEIAAAPHTLFAA